jgi:hypothetical protein
MSMAVAEISMLLQLGQRANYSLVNNKYFSGVCTGILYFMRTLYCSYMSGRDYIRTKVWRMYYQSNSMRSGIECLKRNRKNSHQQPLPGSLGKTGWAKAGVNIPL